MPNVSHSADGAGAPRCSEAATAQDASARVRALQQLLAEIASCAASCRTLAHDLVVADDPQPDSLVALATMLSTIGLIADSALIAGGGAVVLGDADQWLVSPMGRDALAVLRRGAAQ